ncbi:MAG: SDR family NAD(P)-dependent oxidoreductase, partial [Pseudomonadota bacterium]
MGRVEGKAAIVTGAGRGIGRATALALAKEGAWVYATDIHEASAHETATLAGERAQGLVHDVAKEADWAEVIEKVVAERGRIDILVNNAGLLLQKTIGETSLDEFRRVSEVNVMGAYLGCSKVIASMRATSPDGQPAEGSVINLSSIVAKKGFPGTIAYSATKGATRNMARALGVEVGLKGDMIRVNAVLPGAVRTPMTEAYWGG